LNESLFNKFGFGFYTKKVSIFVQQKIDSCIQIKVRHNEIVDSKRLCANDESIAQAKNLLNENGFTCIEYIDNPSIIDSQHVVFENKGYEQSSDIFILGSPTDYKLNAFHHTKAIAKHQLAKLKIFLGI